MGNREFDLLGDVFGRVMLQADDGGAQQHDAMLAQLTAHPLGIRAVELGVPGARRFQAEPDGGDTQFH